MEWYIKVLKQYFDFNGRARRKEFWMFILFNCIFSFAASILDNLLGTYMLFAGIYGLAVLLPGLMVSIRRLHDIGKSGWMILVSLIPLVGAIWLIILFATDSTPGENQYGSNPKGL